MFKKLRKKEVIVVIVVTGSFLLGGLVVFNPYRNLDTWVAHMQYPSDRLLYAGESHKHWLCIFNAGESGLAIFMISRDKRFPTFSGSLSLMDEYGNDVSPGKAGFEVIYPENKVVSEIFGSFGCLNSIRSDHKGNIVIIYEVRERIVIKEACRTMILPDPNKETIRVFEVTIPWNKP